VADVSAGPAARFASSAKSWERNDWWRLEARAWQGQSEVSRALAFFAPKDVWKDLLRSADEGDSVSGRAGGCLRVIGYIIAITAPAVFGFVMLGALLRPRGQVSMVIVGSIMLIAIVVAVLGLVHSVRHPRPGEAKAGRILGMLHAIPSAVGLVAGLMLTGQDRIDHPLLLVVFALDIVIGLIYLVANRGRESEGEARWQRNAIVLKAALDKTPYEQKQAVEKDLQNAFDELFTAGLIDEAEHTRAQGVSLGLLGVAMAPREDMTPQWEI
jgi:hypothetical protein